MKIFAGAALLLLVAWSTAGAQTAPDAMIADPTHHQIIFENDHVRVLEGLAAPGQQSPMHSHPPLAVVGLDRTRVRITQPDGQSGILDLAPGQVLWIGAPFEHAWEVLSGRVHVVAVEVKAARRGAAPSPPPLPENDAVAVDPTHHQVVLENEHIRVFSAMAAPGERSPMHSHPPTLIISLGRARMQLSLPDGTSTIFDLDPSQVYWIEDAVHSWEVVAGEVQVIGVEVKAARG